MIVTSELLMSLIVVLLQHSWLCHASGINSTGPGDSNFQVLLEDVKLGPLSQRPELFKVAAIQNELVNVTDDQQTAVVTVGVNIHLDWSSWVTEVLGADSSLNATYTYYRTQLNDSGSFVGPAEVLQPSEPPERIVVRANVEMTEFYIEITCVIVAGHGQNDSDRAICELEVCVSQYDNEEECRSSNITVYAIERPKALEIMCISRAFIGRVHISCRSSNPITFQSCALEVDGVQTSIPCNDIGSEITFSGLNYPPGAHHFIVNATDIYGQSAQDVELVFISPPVLFGDCFIDGLSLSVNCVTSLDDTQHSSSVIFNCSYDGGPPETCGRNFTIDKTRFTLGDHRLEVYFIGLNNAGPTGSVRYQFTVREFELNCSVDENRTRTVQCKSVGGVIGEALCIYDENLKPPRAVQRELCELPAVIDFKPFDRDAGEHSFTVIANSTIGETANYTYTFYAQRIECVPLTEPGVVTVICASRVRYVGNPFCTLSGLVLEVSCSDLSSVVINSSSPPFPIGEDELSVSFFDAMQDRIRTTVEIAISEEQLVECSTAVNCSSNSTLMSARECCVNSVDGLSYSILGQRQCHTYIVFGWIQDSFNGMERESAYSLLAGYLKGGEQANVPIMFNVNSKLGTANASDYSLGTNQIQVRPMGEPNVVEVTFVTDGIAQEANESLTLHLLPTPSTLQTIPIGEAVFFKNAVSLTVVDGDIIAGKEVNVALIGSTVAIAAFLLVTGIVLLIVILSCYYFCTYQIRRKKVTIWRLDQPKAYSEHSLASSYDLDEQDLDQRKLSVESSFQLALPPHLIVPSSSIKLNETIGQGEFGIVFKGYVIKTHDGQNTFDEYLAIKTLKGFYDHIMVRDMLKECSRMSEFDHLHVLTLKGVCLDGGPAPYIIMPFMANGSLLAYLRKNRKTLVVSNESNDDVEIVRKQLMDMCIQVAKGMEYLASMKVVHRDLAARNCMIDANFVIKVADFGLAESIGVKEYFRQDECSPVKLPLKWLALESITDYIFSEKTDVWAYSVTCWEIFSGGKVPYPELMVREIPKLLAEGYRLERPTNYACNDELYSQMLQCWLLEPEKRPSFSQLVETLSESLEYMAGYVHIGAFGVRTNGAEFHKTVH